MTARTFVAGVRAPRGDAPASLTREHQALAQWYGCLADMALLAQQARPLLAENERLAPKLADPALRDHPKRQAYVVACETRAFQLRVLQQAVDPLLRELALLWERLPEERRTRIHAQEAGWPRETRPVALAHRVWQWMTSESFLWPGRNECPFGWWLVLFGAITLLRAAFRVLGACS